MMALQQPLRRLTIILLGSVIVLGCRTEPDKSSTVVSPNDPDRQQTRESSDDYLSKAKRALRIGDYDSAAESAYKALLQTPNSADAKLIASEAEAFRGNHQASADLAGSIDMRSRLGNRAIEIRYQQLLKLNRHSEAADVILAAIEVMPQRLQWRRTAWSLLNRVGRREEASAQADVLCRTGQAGELELLSLLRRNDAFPFSLRDEKPEKYFEPGLGIARWYFTSGDHRRALEELAPHYDAGFPEPVSGALYGRLLAETQAYDEFPAWYAKCPAESRGHSDYWVALGTFFSDELQFEASAKAFLEATIRDPTDDYAAHRLAKVFDALGRADDAEQFRDRGVNLVQAEQAADKFVAAPTDPRTRDELTQKVLALGRPFEVLQWALLSMPADAVNQRRAIETKRAELSRNKETVAMVAESALFGVDPAEFDLESAMETLERGSSGSAKQASVQVQQRAAPHLVNVAEQVGLHFQWFQDTEMNLASIPIHEMMGGGIAVLDFDLDGWPDVYLSQGSGDPPTDACTRSNILYRNHGGRFESVTDLAEAGDFNYSTGVAAGDVNQDGFADLYLGSLGRNRLLINNGDGTFRDATSQLGEVDDRFTSSLAIADINGDALPDLFEAVYLEMEGGFKLPEVGADGREIQPGPASFFADSDRWYESLGDGSFRVHTIEEEVALAGTSLGLIVTDFDASGANQVFVGNDARANHFLVPSSQDSFRNAADVIGVANGFGGEANACMGIATGDFNRDGTLDFHVTNFSKESANLYLQRTGGGFTDFANRYEIDALSIPYIGFGTKAVDLDRNGWLDLIVANGHVFDQRHLGQEFRMPPQLIVNAGNRFEAAEVEDESGYWDGRYLGRSIAMIDFDRDGAIDFLMGHFDQPLALLHNRTGMQEATAQRRQATDDWIQFELVGRQSERDAIGARVELIMGDQRFVSWVTAGDGYLCSDEAIIDFGLGARQSLPQDETQGRLVDRVEIVWPSGTRQIIEHPPAGRRYLVVEGDATIHPRNSDDQAVETEKNAHSGV